ncbi:MAG: endonuclease VIII, partial [Clostridia bacterium]|nr:endonuclease VIII [Clostridia bacterium]
FGQPGGYQTYLSKKTYDEPCTKCGYPIHRAAYLGGNVYFCEHCQQL